MKKFFFTKFSGAGNDFVLFDKKKNESIELAPEIIKRICDRRNGIGADGVLLIDDIENYNFSMNYFNADGSTGSLCGNGARCAVMYAHNSSRLSGKRAKFLCNKDEFLGEVISDEIVLFHFNRPRNLKENFKIKAYNQLISAAYINTGSPHVIIDIKDVLSNPKNLKSSFTDLGNFPVYEIGQEIRNAPEFMPEGTNVNFVKIENGKILLRTYERGVENETLACGTGAVAAALICSIKKNLTPPVEVITKGEETLTVDFRNKNGSIEDLSLTGPAKEIFRGEILI